jgi:hypothetical protein
VPVPAIPRISHHGPGKPRLALNKGEAAVPPDDSVRAQPFQQRLERALLFFEHAAIRMVVGLMDLVRQLREVSSQDLDEQGSFVVVEGQGVHSSSPFGVLEKAAASAFSGGNAHQGVYPA